MSSSIHYTSTLPEEVMKQLNEYAEKLGLPKNKIIEKALKRYFALLKEEEYIDSFQRARKDRDILKLAEEGFEDLLAMTRDL